ncbi:4'-phosphopantetheinyl transferase family protein [Salipiger sp.]|uniref:4'-phosphopantetheinyl transferase family protein n=1 Tax=Salipiger sp. TaxID=2078585 RepID=UPI003A96A7E4
MTPAQLQALLPQDLPAGLGWAVSGPVASPGRLFPEERALVARAVPARRAEFIGGRLAAREAMARIGLPPAAVPPMPDRAPRWPDGVVGSITHTEGLCLAVVGRAAQWRALGIDLEADTPLQTDLLPEIADRDELATCDLPQELAGKRIFSAKEAAYKAQYPLTRTLFGFDAMRADLAGGELRMVADIGLGRGARLPLTQWVVDGIILSLCALPT